MANFQLVGFARFELPRNKRLEIDAFDDAVGQHALGDFFQLGVVNFFLKQICASGAHLADAGAEIAEGHFGGGRHGVHDTGLEMDFNPTAGFWLQGDIEKMCRFDDRIRQKLPRCVVHLLGGSVSVDQINPTGANRTEIKTDFRNLMADRLAERIGLTGACRQNILNIHTIDHAEIVAIQRGPSRGLPQKGPWIIVIEALSDFPANQEFQQRIIMNWRNLFVVAGACGLLASASALAEPEQGLGREMQAMGGDFKVLSQQINDAPSNPSSLKLVDDLEHHTLAAKGMTPPLVARAPEADRAKMLAKYRGEIAQLLQQELDLEQALLNGDNAKAADLLNKIHDTERQGHHDFRHR